MEKMNMPSDYKIPEEELGKMSLSEEEILEAMHKAEEEIGDTDSKDETSEKDNKTGREKLEAIARIMKQKKIIEEQEKQKKELEEKQVGDRDER